MRTRPSVSAVDVGKLGFVDGVDIFCVDVVVSEIAAVSVIVVVAVVVGSVVVVLIVDGFVVGGGAHRMSSSRRPSGPVQIAIQPPQEDDTQVAPLTEQEDSSQAGTKQ